MLRPRLATAADVRLYHDWANDPDTRQQSFRPDPIPFEQHARWFEAKLADPGTLMLVFVDDAQEPVGQVRIERGEEGAVIGISVDRRFRGLGLASRMIDAACAYFFAEGRGHTVTAHIKSDNPASLSSFRKAQFLPQRETREFGVSSQILVRHSA